MEEKSQKGGGVVTSLFFAFVLLVIAGYSTVVKPLENTMDVQQARIIELENNQKDLLADLRSLETSTVESHSVHEDLYRELDVIHRSDEKTRDLIFKHLVSSAAGHAVADEKISSLEEDLTELKGK